MVSPWGAGALIGALSGSWATPQQDCSPQVEVWRKSPQESLQLEAAFPQPGGQVSRVARRRPGRGPCRGFFSLPQVAALCTTQSWAHLRGWSFQSESKKWIDQNLAILEGSAQTFLPSKKSYLIISMFVHINFLYARYYDKYWNCVNELYYLV